MTTYPNARCILVLGMHRSGTSALTGVLTNLGVNTGSRLLQPHEVDNPKGFWEHADIVSIHDELLKSLEYSWDDVRPLPNEWWKHANISEFRRAIVHIIQRDFSTSALWAVKDPRMCRLLPLWLEILAEVEVKPLIILNLREPCSVARSLQKRDGFSNLKAQLLWIQHFLDAEFWSRGYPREILTYQQLMSDWKTAVESLTKFLTPMEINSSALSAIEHFLEPSLQHHNAREEVIPEDELSRMAHQVYQLALGKPDDLSIPLSSIRARVNTIANEIAPWATSMKETEAQVARLIQENSYLKSEVARIKATFSWQVTTPLRLVANLPYHIKKISASFRDAE